MPCAIDQIRKLGQSGHTVFASDVYRGAPGNHSRHVKRSLTTVSPTQDAVGFVREVADIVTAEQIDLVLPAFEEVFYLARHADMLPAGPRYFFAPFDVLSMLHDKNRFLAFAGDLGLRVPKGIVASDQAELRAAVAEFPSFFAKPVFSRGGVELCTNCGPLAGMLPVEKCDVSSDRPWIVQEFIDGVDVCSMSVVHAGRVAGHATYVHPREIEHAGGIVFESVDEPECLEAARRIAEATNYTGSISFDYKKTEHGMVLIECNPRPTAGVHVMSADEFDHAITGRRGPVRVTPAGRRCMYGAALLRDMVVHPEEAAEDLKYLFSDAKEVVADPDDLVPALFQALSYSQVLKYRKGKGARTPKERALMAAQFEDVHWDGGAIR